MRWKAMRYDDEMTKVEVMMAGG
jgi:hypothetical protein